MDNPALVLVKGPDGKLFSHLEWPKGRHHGASRATSSRFVACNSNEYGQTFRNPSVN